MVDCFYSGRTPPAQTRHEIHEASDTRDWCYVKAGRFYVPRFQSKATRASDHILIPWIFFLVFKVFVFAMFPGTGVVFHSEATDNRMCLDF